MFSRLVEASSLIIIIGTALFVGNKVFNKCNQTSDKEQTFTEKNEVVFDIDTPTSNIDSDNYAIGV